MKIKKFKDIEKVGLKISVLVAIIFVIVVIVLNLLFMSFSRSLITEMFELQCRSGTNLLSYELKKNSNMKSSDDINKLLDELKEQTGCEFTIFNGDQRVNTTIIQDNKRVIGTKLEEKIADKVLNQGESYIGKTKILGVSHIASYVPTKDESGNITGLVFAGLASNVAYAKINIAFIFISIIGLLVLAGSVYFTYKFIKKLITIPLENLTNIACTMEKGNLTLASNDEFLRNSNLNNEIGILSNAIFNTVTRLENYICEISEVLSKIEAEDLTAAPNQEYIGDFVSIKTSLENIAKSLNGKISEINTSSELVSVGANKVSIGAQDIAENSIEEASYVNNLVLSIDEIESKAKDNSKYTVEATTQAKDVGSEMINSNEKMQEMINAMIEIDNSSKEIVKIIKTIEDIASQTNLLALNASIEAARAGETGKGFAVVADEVGKLAIKSTEASKTIESLIKTSVESVKSGSEIAKETAKSLESAVNGVNGIIDKIEKVSQSSKNQENFIAKIKEESSKISSSVETSSATAEEFAAASEELDAQAKILNSLVESFKLCDEN